MERVPIARLKANLAYYLAKLKAGRSFLVTDRRQPVAVFEPVAFDLNDETMRTLVMSSQARPPERELPRDFIERPIPRDPEGKDLAARLEERAFGHSQSVFYA